MPSCRLIFKACTMTMLMRMLSAALLLFGSTSASLLDYKMRMDFLQAMDQATNRRGTNNLSDFQQRIVGKARRLDQGDDAVANDDAAVGDDQYVNNDGLDLREYAFKYVGCQTINSWSDNLAQDQASTTVLAKNSFAVFRMCPADACSTYNKYGCLYDYGEYMILLEDYLELMSQYHYERYAEYCATCDECMNAGNDDAVGNDNNAAGNDAVNDDAANRRWLDQGNDDAVDNDDQAAGDDAVNNQYVCQYETACSNYKEACVNYNSDDVTFDEYFACAQFQDVNGNEIFLGPHCKSDGHSITIGLFSDEYCAEYVGDIAELQSTTGVDFDGDSLGFYYSASCVSCDAQEQYDLNQNDEDGIYDLCEALYNASAKCNRYLYEADKYESDNQEETEEEVCNFIESLVMNTYDENGEINLAKMYFDASNWKDVTEYTKILSPGQIFGLIFSILLMLGLAIYAIYLYHKIRHANRWNFYRTSPRNDPNANLAGKISRVHSGIMWSRSRGSDVGAYA